LLVLEAIEFLNDPYFNRFVFASISIVVFFNGLAGENFGEPYNISGHGETGDA